MSHSFLLLDAARVDEYMDKAKELNATHQSLYKGSAEEDLADVSPYFFSYQKGSEFYNWYAENGWGDSWGLIVKSEFLFEETYRHFRKFLMIKTEDDQQLYFRFYDPRVLRIFLPTCDEKQLKEFFGPVEQFICEDEDPEFALVFSFEKNELKTQRITRESLFETSEQKNQGRKFFV